jgi:hypothetical protein
MNKLQSLEGREKEAIRKIAHPAIGEIYCTQDDLFELMSENWENTLSSLASLQ